ncbi:hypothetical protein R0K18_31895, partial [Pantoea sp. SIMBA_133]
MEIKQSLLQETADQLGITETSPEFTLLSYKHPQIRQWMIFIRDFLALNEEVGSVTNQFFLDNSLTQLSIMMLQYG